MPSKARSKRTTKTTTKGTTRTITKETKFSTIPTRATIGTRGTMNVTDFDNAHDWTNDYDWDDFVEIWNNDGKMPTFYVLINSFLLILKYNYNHDKFYFNEYVREIIKYDTEKPEQDRFSIKIIIQGLLMCIYTQYRTMQLFPTASRRRITNEIVLYHGSNAIRYQSIMANLLALEVNTIFELPIFMSTSILIDVACRFALTSRKIVRIRVKREFLDTFHCSSFLTHDVDLESNTSTKENEILLNLFTKLKFISITHNETISYKVPQLVGSTKTEQGVFTIIDMEFVGNSSKTPEAVLSFLTKQSKQFLSSALGKNKKKYHTKKLATKFKQSKKVYKKKSYYTRKKSNRYRAKINK